MPHPYARTFFQKMNCISSLLKKIVLFSQRKLPRPPPYPANTSPFTFQDLSTEDEELLTKAALLQASVFGGSLNLFKL